MGSSGRIGQQVEQFERTATEAAEEDATHRCRGCNASLHTRHDRCSACNSESIVTMAPAEEASDPSTGGGTLARSVPELDEAG